MVSKAIIDQQLREFGRPAQPATPPSTGPLLAMDLSTGSVQQFILNVDCFVVEPINAPAIGDRVVVIFQQGNAGNHTVTWAVCFRDAPSWSAGAVGTRAIAEFLYDGVSYCCVGNSTAFAVSGLAIVPRAGAISLPSDAISVVANPAPTTVALAVSGVASTLTANTIVSRTPTVGAITATGIASLVSVILTPPVANIVIQGQVPTRSP